MILDVLILWNSTYLFSFLYPLLLLIENKNSLVFLGSEQYPYKVER